MSLKTISGKIREIDRDAAKSHAENFGSNQLEVISAWRTLFESAPEKRQREALNRVRKLHPMPYPRIGRGNRGHNRAA